MKIQFTVTNQMIDCDVRGKVVADSRNYLEAVFFFVTPDWDDVQKTVVFRTELATYNVLLGNNNTCLVPWEALIPGDLRVSVFGGDRITTDEVKIRVFPSGYRVGETPREPTPDVYEQIMERLSGIQAGEVSQQDIENAVRDYFAANPVEAGVTEARVLEIVERYFNEHSGGSGGGLNEEQVRQLVNEIVSGVAVEGPQGPQGPQGLQGVQGEPGEKGDSPTPEEIRVAVDAYFADNPVDSGLTVQDVLGKQMLTLGSSDNHAGALRIFNSGGGSCALSAVSGTVASLAYSFPAAQGTFPVFRSGHAVGDAVTPVYVNGNGELVACSRSVPEAAASVSERMSVSGSGIANGASGSLIVDRTGIISTEAVTVNPGETVLLGELTTERTPSEVLFARPSDETVENVYVVKFRVSGRFISPFKYEGQGDTYLPFKLLTGSDFVSGTKYKAVFDWSDKLLYII